MRLDLQDCGNRCGKKRIARLMRLEGLRPKQKRRFRPRTTEEEEGTSGGRQGARCHLFVAPLTITPLSRFPNRRSSLSTPRGYSATI